jgi:hypothetical protein
MCDCSVIIAGNEVDPFDIPDKPLRFTYTNQGVKRTLISDFRAPGNVNYAAIHRIENAFGVKRGYVFVIGEKV